MGSVGTGPITTMIETEAEPNNLLLKTICKYSQAVKWTNLYLLFNLSTSFKTFYLCNSQGNIIITFTILGLLSVLEKYDDIRFI